MHISILWQGTGKLIVECPFEQGGNHRGRLMLKSLKKHLELERTDPAVGTGQLEMEAFYWWGAKGTVIK